MFAVPQTSPVVPPQCRARLRSQPPASNPPTMPSRGHFGLARGNGSRRSRSRSTFQARRVSVPAISTGKSPLPFLGDPTLHEAAVVASVQRTDVTRGLHGNGLTRRRALRVSTSCLPVGVPGFEPGKPLDPQSSALPGCATPRVMLQTRRSKSVAPPDVAELAWGNSRCGSLQPRVYSIARSADPSQPSATDR